MEPLSSKSIVLNPLNREVVREGIKIDLQAREFLLLEYFLRHPGKTLTKEEILKKIWNYDFDPATNVVDVLICRLRRKIDRPFATKSIRTLHGVGYVFIDI